MKTSDVIKKVAPKARPEYIKAFEQGASALKKAGITTQLRRAHFLAQVLHESNGLTVTFESGNYKPARIMQIFGVGRHSAAVTETEAAKLAGNAEALFERVYGVGNPKKAKEFSNTSPGDGFKYRGGGIIQTTGKSNYKKWGEKIGVDLVAKPELICTADVALMPALYEWAATKCNAEADKNDIGAITRKINGGTNGLDDRKAWFKKVFPLCEDDAPKSMTVPTEAESKEAPPIAVAVNPEILWVQKSLNQLGMDPKLVEDGLEGSKTHEAIRWFQGIRKVPVDGDAGPATVALIQQALETDRADPVPPPPATELAKDGVSVGTAGSGGLTIAGVAAWVAEKWDSIPEGLLNKAVWLIDKPAFWIALAGVGITLFVLWKRNKLRLNFNI